MMADTDLGFLIASIIVSSVLIFGGYMLGRRQRQKDTKGVLRLVYDPDDPEHPAMGLMIESMNDILNNPCIVLKIEKKNFPIKVDIVSDKSPRKKHSL